MIEVGLKGRADRVVTHELSAKAACSGGLNVFATPAMIAMIENAAYESIQPFLEAGSTSVGYKLNVAHLSATPEGMKVWAETEVTAVDGKMVTFAVKAYDEKGLIGEGEHVRAIVQEERFLQKTYGKL